MARIFSKWPVDATTEIIGMSAVAMILTAMEDSIFTALSNLEEVSSITLTPNIFSSGTEVIIKSILSGIILARSLTVPVYIFCYLLVLWSAVFEEKPLLLMPWLIFGPVRNLMMNFICMIIGSGFCIMNGKFQPACIEFLLIKGCELVLFVYLWFSVLQLYHELSGRSRVLTAEDEEKRQLELAARRRKCRSMAHNVSANQAENDYLASSGSDTSRDDDLMHESDSYFKNFCSRSYDSLLVQCHYDWEMVETLSERRYEEEPEDQTEILTLAEKAQRFLRLSKACYNIYYLFDIIIA
ncbi:uncharacterized protein [Periplaneta americana]|uniref:uncharacterized protein n=1 Tax=Periplaneta americana TaxID=6978 RepID=UPI0037E9519B